MKKKRFLSAFFAVRYSDQAPLFMLGLLIIALHIVWLSIPACWPNQHLNYYAVTLTEPIPRYKTFVLRPFNPNFISDYKGYRLGLTTHELDRLTQFRATGKYVQTAKEFQQITGISNAQLAKMAPLFKFPVWKSLIKKNTNWVNYDHKDSKKMPLVLIDINLATTSELEAVRGIGPVLAQRIIQFRDQLGGFYDVSQLMDVWGIKLEVYNESLKHFTLLKPTKTLKINLNQADFNTLRQFPYFNGYLAREIIKKRMQTDNLTLEELTTIKSFPIDKLKNIALYLDF